MHKTSLTSQQISPPGSSWIPPELQVAMQSGSWAVILFFGLVFFFTRSSIASFTKEHLSIMASLTKSNDTHADNSEKLVKSVDRASKTNVVLTKILSQYLKIDLDDLNKDD